jgi:Tfp pilus assembly protein FimT
MKKAFTIVEILVVISAILFLAVISFPSLVALDARYKLNNSADLAMDKLRLAREKTLASEGDSQYGIYFNTDASPNSLIIFKGNDFSLREPSLDEVYDLSPAVEIFDVNFADGTNELAFDKITGSVNNSGNISLRLVSDLSRTKALYIGGLGQISFEALPVASDANRIKDSRHIHFSYSRVVDLSETITLSFNGGSTVKSFILSDFLDGSDLNLVQEIDVNGSVQKISIRTLNGLNQPGMEFCIHRDGRYNNVSLNIGISGDLTGNLAEYSADGLTVNYNSIYVNDFIWK